MSIPADKVAAAVKHIRMADPIMGQAIKQVGTFRLKLERNRFSMLARSVIAQQISTTAARSIRAKLMNLAGTKSLKPESILDLPLDTLRSAGLSQRKAETIHELAAQVVSGEIPLNRAGRMSDEEIIASLIQVKGIGVWTAQMFLIFSMGRLDVFPHADYGVRVALRRLYDLDDLPGRKQSEQIAAPWSPYASIATWYCWRVLDTPQTSNAAPPI